RTAVVRRWDGLSGVVEHDGACDLVLTRTYYPGWTARINDGPEQPVRPVDGGLQAIRLVGRGPSRVVVRYRPAGWPVAVGVSILATATAVIVVGWSLVRRRPQARPA